MYLERYMGKIEKNKYNKAAIAYLASLDYLMQASPQVAEVIIQELRDQRTFLKLIASENFCSLGVQLAMGNLLTDKYSEGYPGHRFYAGCENVDKLESLAIESLKKLFGCDHAYVQPHSGIDANLVAFWAILIDRVQTPEMEKLGKKNLEDLTEEEYEKIRQLLVNQKVMGMALSAGGHLTHGYRHNISSKMMKATTYGVNPITQKLDYAELQKQVKEVRPDILIAGYSSYPRLINFAKMKEIAHSVGAVFLVDMAHFAGLVAGKVMTGDYDPVLHADIVTSTTHKTLRGPRGGIVLSKEKYRDILNKGCPLILGGPLPHVIAAKAIAFQEALHPSFRDYAEQIVKNAKAMAEHFLSHGITLTTGGTDNHLLVLDVEKSFGLNGRQAEIVLRQALMTVNRNMIPFDTQGAWYTSGIRVGTSALTTLGMKEQEMIKIADLIIKTLKATQPVEGKDKKLSTKFLIDSHLLQEVSSEIKHLLKRFPLYPEITID